MSWLWSSPPSPDESTSTPPDHISVDPYAPTSTSNYPTDFGTAFGDDVVDSTSLSPETANSFDIYVNPTSQPPLEDSAPTFSASFESPTSLDPAANSPNLDFGAMRRIDPTLVSPRAALRAPIAGGASPAVDYVFADDYRGFRKKSGTEQLTYLAGSAYLTGAVLGGSKGFYDALRASAGKPAKLRLNAVLNGAGKRGSMMANAFGVLTLAFSLSESAIYNYTSDESVTNYALAGAAAGGLYKSTRGPRVAAIWAAAGAVAALGTVYASREGFYGKGLQGIL